MLAVCTPGAPVTSPVTKFGGQPVWLAEPTWPVSRELGTPMVFLGQIRLPGPEVRLAYLFMTDDSDVHVDDTWEPEAGENACLVQPGPVPSFLTTEPLVAGPTYDDQDYAVELVQPTGEVTSGDTAIGGSPVWMQNPEWPEGDWRFIGQFAGLPMSRTPNFGDVGTAYAFVEESTWEGRFLWQCH